MIDKQTAEHFPWGDNCDGWHLARTSALSVIEQRMPPDTVEDRHYHKHAHQFFYVIEGVLIMEVDQNEFSLSAGQGIEVTEGSSHHVSNRSTSDVRFLVISNPPTQGDRILVDSRM